jgi:hypothetical protein
LRVLYFAYTSSICKHTYFFSHSACEKSSTIFSR